MNVQQTTDATRMTDRDIARLRDAGAVAILPVGAVEQHGPHLPIDTDSVSAHAVSLGAARRAQNGHYVVFPPLMYGFSPHHLSRPGTISMGLEVFLGQVRHGVRCLLDSRFRRVALVNGHGGNSAPLRSAVTEMVTEGLPVTSVNYWEPSRPAWVRLLRGKMRDIGHACEFETALQLAVRDRSLSAEIAARSRTLHPRFTPPFVAPDAEDGFTPVDAVAPPIFLSGDPGYYGDPAAATRKTGIALLKTSSAGLADFLSWFAATPLVTGRD